LPEVLTDAFLQSLVRSLITDNMVGVILTGSQAWSPPGQSSDIDLTHFVRVLPAGRHDAYYLRRCHGWLVSGQHTTVEAERAKLSDPAAAIWAVPGMRHARILHDPSGVIARLQGEAESFDWSRLQPAANEFAGYEIMGAAEEVQKIVSGLDRADDSAVSYATYGLVLNVARLVAVQRGILVPSENQYFDLVQDAMKAEPAWIYWFREAAGLEESLESGAPAQRRGRAALHLYEATAQALQGTIAPRDREVVEQALALVQSVLDTLPDASCRHSADGEP
jgi:hypothetical protein